MQITTDEIQGEASAEYSGTQWKSCLQIFIYFVFLFGSGGDSDHGEPGGFGEGLAVAETSAERRITRNLTRVFKSGVFISRGSDSSLTHWRHMGCLFSDSVMRHVWRYSDILHLGKKKGSLAISNPNWQHYWPVVVYFFTVTFCADDRYNIACQ